MWNVSNREKNSQVKKGKKGIGPYRESYQTLLRTRWAHFPPPIKFGFGDDNFARIVLHSLRHKAVFVLLHIEVTKQALPARVYLKFIWTSKSHREEGKVCLWTSQIFTCTFSHFQTKQPVSRVQYFLLLVLSFGKPIFNLLS